MNQVSQDHKQKNKEGEGDTEEGEDSDFLLVVMTHARHGS